MNHEEISGRIVEAETYVENDIASKTLRRRKVFDQLRSQDCGTIFIFMVHGNWLLNIVAHPKGSMGGVLIRAIEPIEGIETMKKDRNVGDQKNLTNGPGKLTKALAITKELNRTDVTRRHAELAIIEDASTFEIGSSHRIGVTRDLPKELRFFIEANKYVSKR